MPTVVCRISPEYGVQIMTPNYEADPEQPKLVPREQWYSAPAGAGDPK
jgi:hypothetical protein